MCSESPHQRQSLRTAVVLCCSARLPCSGKKRCFLVLEYDWTGLGSASWLSVRSRTGPVSSGLLPESPSFCCSPLSPYFNPTRVSLANSTGEHMDGFLALWINTAHLGGREGAGGVGLTLDCRFRGRADSRGMSASPALFTCRGSQAWSPDEQDLRAISNHRTLKKESVCLLPPEEGWVLSLSCDPMCGTWKTHFA